MNSFDNAEDVIDRTHEIYSFKEFNFSYKFINTSFHTKLVRRMQELITLYFNDIKIKPMFKPGKIEALRIKKYKADGNDRFDMHIDVSNGAAAHRAVAMLFYLNDNDGYTDFPTKNIRVKPKKGRVVIFPPTWEYPHTGTKPSTEKYIMSSYLHYG